MSNSLKYMLIGVAIPVVMFWGAEGQYSFADLIGGVIFFGAIGFGVARFKDTN